MRFVATLLIVVGLGTLTLVAATQHDIGIAVVAALLAVAWLTAVAWRAPRVLHTGALTLATSLCAVSATLHVSLAVVILCLSTSLSAWDLCLMERSTSTHPHHTIYRLHRRYIRRNLAVLGLAGVLTAAVFGLRLRIPFWGAFGLLCLCFFLFVIVFRRAWSLMRPQPEAKEERAAEPPA